nr:cytochrome P450 CYP82D47-like [Ipomoea trifida]
MEFPSLLCNNIIVPTLACSIFALLFIKLLLSPKNDAKRQNLPPEASGAWPIIGHLHLLAGGKTPIHQILASMADKHGPIFRIRLGSQQALVVSDSKIAKECFTAKDKELATRPKYLASEIMGYNYSMFAVAPYGEYWREIRKIVMLELLSSRRIEMLRKVRESHESVWRDVGVGFYSMAEMDGLGRVREGYEDRKTAQEIDCAADRWLKEHRTKRNLKSKEEEDFMDAMLSLFDDPSNQTHPLGFDTDVVIKSTCLRIQDELDTHIGKERCIEESDINQLIYLQAVVKETLRLHPAVPISLPHEAIEDCTISGYHIQKGTRVIPNFAKIHRDPQVWADPNEFRPERFLTSHKDVDVKGNNFELIPFGSGRRMCPGLTLALSVVHLTLATLIHSFDMKRPSVEPIDMTESTGLTTLKATPLHALLIPRLTSNLRGANQSGGANLTILELQGPILVLCVWGPNLGTRLSPELGALEVPRPSSKLNALEVPRQALSSAPWLLRNVGSDVCVAYNAPEGRIPGIVICCVAV